MEDGCALKVPRLSVYIFYIFKFYRIARLASTATMSRLIVKNLPNGMKEERFRSMFAAFGTLTDCSLKFTKEGKFRKFGFVGFRSEEEAGTALKHFNKSFVDTARITVECCKPFGDATKAKAWSKHSRKSVSTEGKEPGQQKEAAAVKKEKKKKAITSTLGELKEDQDFKEFLAVHQNRAQVPTWANDTLTEPKKNKEQDEKKKKAATDYLNFDSDQSSEEEEEEESTERSRETGLSDMDYLRSKVVSEREEESEEEESAADRKLPPQADGAYESGDKGTAQTLTDKKKGKQNQTEPTTPYTVKLRGAPFNVKEQQVQEFLVPLKPVAIRIVRNVHGNKTGSIFVDLKSEDEVLKALQRNKDYLGGRYIEVFRAKAAPEGRPEKRGGEEKDWRRQLKEDEEEEEVSESGRLFVRNLPYTCSEEDISGLFSKYGPLSEVHFPIDSLTKKPKGFAFITFLIPEHAVKALAELDGHIFQGRMLHLLPSTIKKEKVEEGPSAPGASSYKKQKDSKDKASGASSHNWNTLFVGTSAVADAIAQKYNTTKSQVLDHEARGSVAVRMALGETQIVQETRQFLLDNKVSLDSFSQALGPRSGTVILVKNLPAGVQGPELEAVFAPFGSLGRVLLPPAGLTAIVEFLEPTEAKRAFTKLAYTKFQHVPLYLEWAPMDVFSGPLPNSVQKQEPLCSPALEVKETKPESSGEGGSEEEEEEEEEESQPGCTLFIKNLNFTTTEDTLRQAFSKCGALRSCSISKKKDRSGNMLSMGYGFVEFKKAESAQKALRQLQHCMVEEHQLELKLSERATKATVTSVRKKQQSKKQTSSKILVRNVPFQASVREVRELFSTFGELKTVRLPKKMSGTGTHRGFGFIDFLTKQDAKKAFTALCHSTHLYGRRLVLEWADSEESVETLRRKTAQHFHDGPKKKRSEVMEDIMDQMETAEED
ncbi:probable RNA-binding protein 19 isoform X2 [Acipenser ruthenus]|uniref:probable RNA-binding protein 19 isoform X2 n=1 Tax=Acipenser ruthenus TaxID=7906 RepID=UPI0027418F15|nr:probable RNA-binding protein 19 isoform X2 [Acipenser ruthenus]